MMKYLMNEKDLLRNEVIRMACQGLFTVKQAAERLRLN